MQLVLRNGVILATHDDGQQLRGLYPGCLIVNYNGNATPGDVDPRSNEEKSRAYRDQRRLAYPPLEDQLDMIYWDKINGTSIWRDAIAAVKTRYPKTQ
jgi:hypothetical protein